MSFRFLFLSLSTLSNLLVAVRAQLLHEQYFTRGLAIVDVPRPGNQFTVGRTFVVAVDVSGNGRLRPGSYGPNSTLKTGFISLGLFLISDSYNLTMINATTGDFLAGDPEASVKVLTYAAPSCLSEGDYNCTYYERSRMNGTEYFAITPIQIHILNPHGSSGPCDANVTNPVLPRPQNDSAPAQNPFTYTAGASPASTIAMYMVALFTAMLSISLHL